MNFDQARFNMIEQQVRPWSVLDDTVLNTMQSIPRELFAPESVKSLSYADIEVPLDHNQAMMFPRVEGRMLQELEIGIEDECLEIGTGSGYVTACLAMMGKHVDSIDIFDSFLERAGNTLTSLNISNVLLENKDAFHINTYKKYDAIAITGSLPEYDPTFENMLTTNGRLFVIIGSNQTMHAMKVTRLNHTDFERVSLFETELQPLTGIEQKKTFQF